MSEMRSYPGSFRSACEVSGAPGKNGRNAKADAGKN